MAEPSAPVILRDGTTVLLRAAAAGDAPTLSAFIGRLEARAGRPSPLREGGDGPLPLEHLCDGADPTVRLTLLAVRTQAGVEQIAGAAGYVACADGTAQIALGVDESFRGQGLATALVERVALAAAHAGLHRLRARVAESNAPMLEVLRRSGYSVGEQRDGEAVEIDLAVAVHGEALERSELRDRLAAAASMRPFFRPRAVVVIGASRDEESLGFLTLHRLVLQRFRGPVYAVNPRAASIGAIPAYPSVASLPGPVDLAIVLVPKQHVEAVVDDCAAAGVRALVVITAGFAEVGEEGQVRQDALLAKVRGYGMRMVGPNCMGLINADPEVRLAATFAPAFPPAGNVAMSSQSGALGLAILATAEELGIGLSTFVSVGNKADVSANDLLQYWEGDEQTDVILLYVESFGNPRRFARIARRIGRTKPIVAVKSGRTGAGKRAAGSHTAALAESDVAVDALFHQTGVIRAETLEEMFDLALVLSSQPLPRGGRVAILTNAGGPGILAADACEAYGLEIAELSADVRARLQAFLPMEASTTNPVDMIAGAGASEYAQAAEILLRAPEVDALILIHAPIEASHLIPVEEALHGVLARLEEDAHKPVLTCLMGSGGRGPARRLQRGVPSFAFPEAAARALGRVAQYARWRDEPIGAEPTLEGFDAEAARAVCTGVLGERGAGWLLPDEVQALADAVGLPLLAGHVARTADEAVRAAAAIGQAVVLKLVSLTLVHKTDLGGVVLNLTDEAGVRAAFEGIRQRVQDAGHVDAFEGVLIQPMLAGGIEIMAGMTEDPAFGPLIAFGLGGVLVEVLGDVVFRVAPLTDKDALGMVRGIRGRKLLEGYRGQAAADEPALVDLLLRLSRLVEEVAEIDDLDINPAFALAPGEGCRIVDMRIHVRAHGGSRSR
ncbi:MAG: GNAT family N-acetyltransferase [Planctomycetota bacterium]|nr:GNAT family N-acetyltransferase [Planctomycetota bacterium]